MTVYTVTEAAKKTGLCDKTIRNAVASGQLPALKIGSYMWVIDGRELAKWLQARNDRRNDPNRKVGRPPKEVKV